MWFVDGTKPNGQNVTDGPFATFEEAELWAATHDFVDYMVNDWCEPDLLVDYDFLDFLDNIDNLVA